MPEIREGRHSQPSLGDQVNEFQVKPKHIDNEKAASTQLAHMISHPSSLLQRHLCKALAELTARPVPAGLMFGTSRYHAVLLDAMVSEMYV